ncbi:MAG: hypothetical protein JST12_10500 [Armatimonadetes bacterium]|nr:hypothetical protein [Armatimonadota bacterium]
MELPKIAQPAVRALNSVGVTTLEQLQNFTEPEIKTLHGMGPNALGKLKAAMAEKGLNFKEA